MISNNTEENDTSIVFETNDIFVPSASFDPNITTSTNNHTDNNTRYNYLPLVDNMLDTEFDSDPQMSDSELSWQSVTDVDSLTATNHWRGWKQQTTTSLTTIKSTYNSSMLTNSTSLCSTSLANSSEGLIELEHQRNT